MQSDLDALFRQEVVEAKRGEWLGTIQLAMPVPTKFFAALSLAAGLLLVALLAFGRYTHRERITGQLVPSLGLLTTSSPSAGTVAHILAHEGDMVEKDQPLVEISTELDSVSIGKTHAAISGELKTQRVQTIESLKDQAQLSAKKQEATKSNVELLHRQLQHIDAQIEIQNKRAESAHDLWQKFQSTSNRGVVSGVQIEQQRSTALSAQAECASLRRQRTEVEQQVNAQQELLRELPLSASAERAALQQKLADIDQALAQSESQRAVLLRASASGLISDVMVKDGQTVSAGQRLLSLVPQGSELQAELWLPSRAIGFVVPGDRVVLRYQAFPYQKFGQQYGEVHRISRSASSATELTSVLGKNVGEASYRVTVTLERQSILAYGKQETLKPGMALEADILLGDRRLIEWIFEPLFGFEAATASTRT